MRQEDWIKVADRLPVADWDVLVYDDAYGVIIASYDDINGWLSYEHGVLENVTHWMELVLPKRD